VQKAKPLNSLNNNEALLLLQINKLQMKKARWFRSAGLSYLFYTVAISVWHGGKIQGRPESLPIG
jgi:hypothetical protein